MCVQKPTGNGARKKTPSGIVYYDDTPDGHAAQSEDEAASSGPGSDESDHPEPAGAPAPNDTPAEDCTVYSDKLWDTACSKYYKFAHMKMKPDTPAIACSWQQLCKEILDKIVDGGIKFNINSAYRSSAYNAKIGGATKSDHLTGCATDIATGSVEGNKALFKWIGNPKNKVPFSQIIFEGNWVHVAYNGASPASVAVLVTRTGKPSYENGGGRDGSRLPPDLKWA